MTSVLASPQCLQLLGLLETALAAVFLANAGIGLRPETIVKLSGMNWDHNPALAKALVAQEADTFVGLLLLFLGVLAGMWSIRSPSQPPSTADLAVCGLTVSLCVVVAIVVRHRRRVTKLARVIANLEAGRCEVAS